MAVAVWIKPPPVPVMVMVKVPFDAPLGTARLMVTCAISLPETRVTEFGTRLHFDPGGPPLHVNEIAPWNPLGDDAVRVNVPM